MAKKPVTSREWFAVTEFGLATRRLGMCTNFKSVVRVVSVSQARDTEALPSKYGIKERTPATLRAS